VILTQEARSGRVQTLRTWGIIAKVGSEKVVSAADLGLDDQQAQWHKTVRGNKGQKGHSEQYCNTTYSLSPFQVIDGYF